MSKPRGRSFEPGNTFGRGRPPGSRNRKIAGEAQGLFEEHGMNVSRKLIALALQGNIQALRICVERAVPVPRDVPVVMKLGKIRSTEDIDTASAKLIQQVSKGAISPAAGGTMMNVLEGYSRVRGRTVIENDLRKLEESVEGDETERRVR